MKILLLQLAVAQSRQLEQSNQTIISDITNDNKRHPLTSLSESNMETWSLDGFRWKRKQLFLICMNLIKPYNFAFWSYCNILCQLLISTLLQKEIRKVQKKKKKAKRIIWVLKNKSSEYRELKRSILLVLSKRRVRYDLIRVCKHIYKDFSDSSLNLADKGITRSKDSVIMTY